MYKPLFVAIALLAQALVPTSVAPMPPRAMPPQAMPMGAIPVMPRDTRSGIMVSGAAVVNAPAASADVTLHVSTRNNTLTLNQQTLQPVIDAIARAGVPRDAISLPPYMVGQARTNMAQIVAHVNHPTEAMLRQGMLVLANAFAGMPDILLNDAYVMVHGDNCDALFTQAEAHAIAQARKNAEFIAKQNGVHIGELLAAEEDTPAPTECSRGFGVGPYGTGAAGDNFADLLTIQVRSNVQMRFAIKR